MSQENGKWACHYCTYENWPKAIKCTICLAPRPPPLISQEATNQERDIYKMAPLITESNIDPPREHSSTALSSTNPYNKWACHMCTYLNWPRATKCTQCLTPRKRSSPMSSSSPTSPKSEQGSPGQKHFQPEPEPGTTVSDNYHNDRNKAWNRCVKWPCTCCTYENWPKSVKCVLCHALRPRSEPSATHIANDVEDIRRRPQTSRGEACQRLSPPGAHSVTNLNTSTTSGSRRIQNNRCSEITEIQRDDLLSLLLSHTGMSHPVAKRVPSDVSRDIAADVRRHIASSLKQKKGEFPCYFVTEFVTFALPAEIDDFPTAVQERLFDELLDRDVQKELEEESPIINWSLELTERLGSRLYALWNRSAGDCLLDSALQATWGVFDRENTLRRALGDSLCEAAPVLYPRWKEAETLQANLLHFSLDETQWQEDWAMLLSLATQPGSALEQMHIFTLAHILRRPIIVYGVKYVKSFRGEALGYARFEGIYLPMLWEPNFCWKSPIALGYTRGHFSALVPMEPDSGDVLGAGANTRTTDDLQVVFLPLMTSDHQLLPLHFLTQSELGREEEIMRQWLDCCVTEGGTLVAQQRIPKRPILVAQMVDEWLDFYRSLTHRPHAASPTSDTHAQPYSSDGDSDQE